MRASMRMRLPSGRGLGNEFVESGKWRAVDAAAANAVRNHQVDGVARALLVVERFGKDGIGI